MVEVAPDVQVIVPVAQIHVLAAHGGTGEFHEFVLGLRAQMRTQHAVVVHKELVLFVFVYLLVLLSHSYLLELGFAPGVPIELWHQIQQAERFP